MKVEANRHRHVRIVGVRESNGCDTYIDSSTAYINLGVVE